MNKIHKLKIKPAFYHLVITGQKNFELRKNDRNFKVGDIVELHEWNGKDFTGNQYPVRIKYVLENVPEFGLKADHCIFSW